MTTGTNQRLRPQRSTSNARPRSFVHTVARTAASNVTAAAAAAIAGIVVARALGPSARGEYAAIIVWSGVTLAFGELGQTAATTYFVARDPGRGRDYLATSRVMMIISGLATIVIGFLVAPLLAPEHSSVVWGYRLMFATCLSGFVGASYTFSLQASSISRWNLVRIFQPALFLITVLVLYAARQLSLTTALITLSVTIVAQLALAVQMCRRAGLAGGRADRDLARPMIRYGMGQLAATAPTVINGYIDQLVLSVTVEPASLGYYAIAVALTRLAIPVVSAVGNVAFPRIAAQVAVGAVTARLHRRALAASAVTGLALMIPTSALAPWLVPAVFGAQFRHAVPLIWLLAPSGVLLACGQVCGDLLRGHGRPLAVAKAQGVAAVVTVALLAALLPAYGLAGAAVSACVGAAISLALMIRTLEQLARQADRAPAIKA